MIRRLARKGRAGVHLALAFTCGIVVTFAPHEPLVQEARQVVGEVLGQVREVQHRDVADAHAKVRQAALGRDAGARWGQVHVDPGGAHHHVLEAGAADGAHLGAQPARQGVAVPRGPALVPGLDHDLSQGRERLQVQHKVHGGERHVHGLARRRRLRRGKLRVDLHHEHLRERRLGLGGALRVEDVARLEVREDFFVLWLVAQPEIGPHEAARRRRLRHAAQLGDARVVDADLVDRAVRVVVLRVDHLEAEARRVDDHATGGAAGALLGLHPHVHGVDAQREHQPLVLEVAAQQQRCRAGRHRREVVAVLLLVVREVDGGAVHGLGARLDVLQLAIFEALQRPP
mmetsp:Transcript_30021/g.95939  ORF Transcript_30021/g.95939 Transcript_30021/m.95939 type:complete len:344 (+) Transcript_30021:1069-2100(+)